MNLGKLEQYKSWLISAGIAVGIALWLVTGGTEDDAVPAAESIGQANIAAPKASVRVRAQTAEEVTRTIAVNGRTLPARTVEINAETDGRVVAVGGERGERLAIGDVIVRLDLRDRQARLSEARAIMRQRELEFAARDKLMDQSYVSEAQLQEAAALLESARSELARAELDLDNMVIRAPFDGALQERQVEIGDYVKNGDPVATFVDERRLIVSANVSEYDAHHVRRGIEGSARLATGETVNGVIRYVAPVADEATRTFTVELESTIAAAKSHAAIAAATLEALCVWVGDEHEELWHAALDACAARRTRGLSAKRRASPRSTRSVHRRGTGQRRGSRQRRR